MSASFASSNSGPKTANPPLARNAPVPVLGHIRETLPMPFVLSQPEEQTDNWDDDFEEGPSLTKIHGPYCIRGIYCYQDLTAFN